jgi:hypothetical protein
VKLHLVNEHGKVGKWKGLCEGVVGLKNGFSGEVRSLDFSLGSLLVSPFDPHEGGVKLLRVWFIRYFGSDHLHAVHTLFRGGK